MIEKILKKKYLISALILAIMIGAFAVRFYHFHDWLYFKMDQARDSFTIANAVKNGPGELPLLGPRAGATKVTYGFLRLGPVFYYLEYLSGAIFHSTDPQVFAYPDLFFGVMVIPLLYLFSRLYFSRLVSLLIALMYPFSYLIIEYSRFAWNPNSLPFFTILSFYSLLKFLNDPVRKNRKWWIALWATGLVVGSQLHFLGFFSLVGISALIFVFHYKLWDKKEIGKVFQKKALKKVFFYGGVTLAVFLIFYSPVIISDSLKHGENTKDFIQAFSSKQSKAPIMSKFQGNINAQIKYYTMIATSYISSSKNTSSDLPPIIFTLAIFLAGIYLAVKSFKRTNDPLRKDFILLIILWIGFFFFLTTPVSDQIRPRYFIFTFAVPFILLGFIFEFLENKKDKRFLPPIFILTAAVLFFNGYGTYAWFKEQAKSQTKHFGITRTLILKAKDGVTLGQLEAAANYIDSRRTGDNRIYFYVKPEHVRPLQYLFSEIDPALQYFQFQMNDDPKAQYFAVVPADYKVDAIASKVGQFETVSEKQFGQIDVWEINFPNRVISNNFTVKKSSAKSDRIYWKNIFGIKEKSSSDANMGD